MTAGLFAAHGVFFGHCPAGNEWNPKGYFEHPEIKHRTEGGGFKNWPDAWWDILEREGYQLTNWWGVKRGPKAWPWVRMLEPELIVICERPGTQIVASHRRMWPAVTGAEGILRRERGRLRRIEREAECGVIRVRTDRMVAGDYRQIELAFSKLGLWFEPEKADEWIDKSLWNRAGAGVRT